MLRRLLTEGIGETDLTRLAAYRARGGYGALASALSTMSGAEVAAEVALARRRGRGGAFVPAAFKWGTLPDDGRPRFLVVNADESEPGSFSGRLLITEHPHLVLEGALLSAYACGCGRIFVYVRGEFHEGHTVLCRAVAEARAAGLIGPRILGSGFDVEVVVHRGAGAYICGEETAILESLEGRRGHPRPRPPWPTAAGLYGQPTLVHNVETVANVPVIVQGGGARFAAIGAAGCPGTKICSVSGRVRRPGNYEVETGTPLRVLLEDGAGGCEAGHSLRFVLPAGASSALVPPGRLEVPLDPDAMRAAGTMLGSAGMVVCDERDCPVAVARLAARFYHHESCGKCTPCREGTGWAERILQRLGNGAGRPGDARRLEALCRGIGGGTCLCPLGAFSVAYLQSALLAFPEVFAAHERAACPLCARGPAHRRATGPAGAVQGLPAKGPAERMAYRR